MATSDLQVFTNVAFGTIRTIETDRKNFFCGRDVATTLGYKDSVVVERFCSLVQAGSSVRAAAGSGGLPVSVGYRLARQLDVAVRPYRVTSLEESERITDMWLAGWAPIDIARQCEVGTSVVCRIGIELGLWKTEPAWPTSCCNHQTLPQRAYLNIGHARVGRLLRISGN